MHVLFGIAV